jgi:uncharacterized protein
MDPIRLAMFPLGSVLFPGFGLPLHVFEPRYRLMVEHLLEPVIATRSHELELADLHVNPAEPICFGVTLIERGSEVGGGEKRFNVGTTAQIIEAGQTEDGRWALQTAGTQRFHVLEWLPDAPYPQAIVEMLDDVHGALSGSDLVVEIDAAVRDLRRVLALSAEADVPTSPATIELSDDPTIRLWQACGVAPIGPMDDFLLLSANTMTDRVRLLRGCLEDARVLLANRLANG